MAARAACGYSVDRAPHTPHPASRGAPGAKGDRLRIKRTPSGAPDGHHPSRMTELRISTTNHRKLTVDQLSAHREHCTAARLCTTVLVTMLLASVPASTSPTDRPARDNCHKNQHSFKNHTDNTQSRNRQPTPRDRFYCCPCMYAWSRHTRTRVRARSRASGHTFL